MGSYVLNGKLQCAQLDIIGVLNRKLCAQLDILGVLNLCAQLCAQLDIIGMLNAKVFWVLHWKSMVCIL